MVSLNGFNIQDRGLFILEEFRRLPDLSQNKAREIMDHFKDAHHDFLADEVRRRRITDEEYTSRLIEFARLWKEAEEFVKRLPEEPEPEKIRARKKILVLISEGGGGHKSAGDSLKELLGQYHDVEIINVLKDVLYPLDPINVVTDGTMTGEDFYNFSLQMCMHGILSWYARAGKLYMLLRKKKVQTLFSKYLDSRSKPDLIISTLPFVNLGISRSAHEKNIPFLLVPTDLHTGTFLSGFKQFKENAQFKMALPYEDPEVRLKVLHSSNLKAKQLAITGFPVRAACLKKYTAEEIVQLRKKHGMLPGYETITLLAGALGGEVLYEHTKAIASIPRKNCLGPLEANICIGRNPRIGQVITNWALKEGGEVIKQTPQCTTLKCASGTILHIRGFTPDIIEIIACSKLLITKTGSCSVNEAIYLGIPLLLDNTKSSSARHLWWERFNIGFIRKIGYGDAFSKSKELKTLVPRFLKHSLALSPFSPPDFSQKILNLVDEML